MALYDNREVYKGMTIEEISSELQLDAIESKVKKLEAVTTDIELDTLRLEDQVFDAKIKNKYQELKATYGEELTRNQFVELSGYSTVKANDYITAYGSYNTLTVAKTLINDSEYQMTLQASREKLIDYLNTRYSKQGIPVEYLELECQEDSKVVLKQAKKLMGLTPKARLEFVPATIVVDIIMEDLL